MRIYSNWGECYEEIKRDLAEMGTIVKSRTMQDKVVVGNTDYITKELQNYCYTLLDVKSENISGVIQPWALAEFKERITDTFGKDPINPGEAYKLREDVWDEFVHNGKFAYTYNERLMLEDQLEHIIDCLNDDENTRQAWLSIWSPERDAINLGGKCRVPCSLGYGFQFRNGKLNMHYVMRSCDFGTHFVNDVYLAIKLLEYVAKRLEVEVGNFTHTIFSLHVYNKDVENVF